jgi:beta-glucosidase
VDDNAGAANQMMKYAAGPNAKITLDKINGMQRFFVENTRLGIPMMPFDEALHGLVRQGATSFPQSIAMAASWDTTLMRKVSDAITLETKARGLRMVLSPVVNIATDVRWGRVEETYGEDPFLTSLFGVIYVSSMESKGIVTTPKHFVANHGDGGRDSYPVFGSERLMNETYFKPFRDAIQIGGARSIMTAYNSYDGRPCTANNYLLNDVLRKQWGFRGFVISDAAATGGANVLHFTANDYSDAGKQAIENGLDVIFQTSFNSYSLFSDPFLYEDVNQEKVDNAVRNVLRTKFEIGLFDAPYVSDELLNELDLNAHRKLAYEMALKSAVLLQNENEILPFSSNYKSIAIIGVDAVEARLGGYSGPGNSSVSILDGIKKAASQSTEIFYAEGCGRVDEKYTAVSSKNLLHTDENKQLAMGLSGMYFRSANKANCPIVTRVDQQIDFNWSLFGPIADFPYDNFGVDWEGFVRADKSGKFDIGIRGNDGYKLFLNDQLVIDRSNDQSFHETTVPFDFEKDKLVKIKIVYTERSGNSKFKLIWNGEKEYTAEKQIQDAINIANKAEIAVVVVGLEEGEFRDRSDLKLPGRQEEMIQRIAATGKPVVVVVVGGSAFTSESWIENVDALLDVWYPGEAGGDAVAALLFGKENPSGRLPITFPKSVGQLPLNYNHLPTGRGDDYDTESGQAQFPFGFGLSYTNFTYSKLNVWPQKFSESDTVIVSFTITNTGKYAGDEVVQFYSRDEVSSIARPIKELKAFQRIHLEPNESKVVTFSFTSKDFAFLDENMKSIVEPGLFRLMIGSSSKRIELRTIIEFEE